MRIDNAQGVKAWLVGKFSGSFKGTLEGNAQTAYYANTASYVLTASYVEPKGLVKSLNTMLDSDTPDMWSVVNRLRYDGVITAKEGVKVLSGSVEIESGSLRIGRAVLEFVGGETEDRDSLQFKFISATPDTGSEPTGSDDSGSCICSNCPLTGSCPHYVPPPPEGWPVPAPPSCSCCRNVKLSIDYVPGRTITLP